MNLQVEGYSVTVRGPDASGTHGGHGVLRDQQRRGSPRDGGCGDGDVALGQDFPESSGTIGTLIIRIRFWGPLYYTYN